MRIHDQLYIGGRLVSPSGTAKNSAAILLDDVDLDKQIPELLPFAMMNSGQACIA